jgi:hypothetical protein
MIDISTYILTVGGGVLVFVFCECIKEIWLMPLQEYKKIKSRVSYTLAMYANLYYNPIPYEQPANKIPDNYEQASIELRKLASELGAFIETLSWVKPSIPKKGNLYDASSNLFALSSGLFVLKNVDMYEYIEYNGKREERIYTLLKIRK